MQVWLMDGFWVNNQVAVAARAACHPAQALLLKVVYRIDNLTGVTKHRPSVWELKHAPGMPTRGGVSWLHGVG